MERPLFLEYISEQPWKEEITAIYDFFEPRITEFNERAYPDNDNDLERYISDVRRSIEENEIIETLTRLRKKTRSYKPIRPILSSFSRNLSDFQSNSRGAVIDREKLRKVLCSACSAETSLISADEVNEIVDGVRKGKIILYMGVEDKKGSDISKSIRKEMADLIVRAKKQSKDYAVLPVLECSTDVFRALMGNINFYGIHIAGHGANNPPRIAFSDKLIGIKAFNTIVSDHPREYTLLNCCHSFEFVRSTTVVDTKYIIAHIGELDCSHAEALTKSLYERLMLNGMDFYGAAFCAITSNYGRYRLLNGSL